ncbi:glycoside hydrolase family 65 protein [Pseudomonas matsuisoli]|uniref:Family 65 glycosyl hydrolase n=1 Tax=Pseudomonas matsuisoli TaxID=1515666 RepID=A0A917PYF9_9PSED|nr:glycoside hydrolase family 65 protein [Pseudomonas matsuisoli]GGJ99560.1 family 65 glycosyl hydrolase [Pseudomonas matsuisoli]
MLERDWRVEFDHYDKDDERRRTSLFALSNGVLSCRPSAPEAAEGRIPGQDSEHYAGFYRAGWYDDAPRLVAGRTTDVAALVNLPHPFGLSIRLDGGEWLSTETLERRHYRQRLHLNDAIVEREMTFLLDGHEISLRERWLVDMAEANRASLCWTLRIPPAVERLDVRSAIDARVANTALVRSRAYEGQRLQAIEVEVAGEGDAAVSAALHDRRWRVAMASRVRVYPAPEHVSATHADDHAQFTFACVRPADGGLAVELSVAALVDTELPPYDTDARRAVLEHLPDIRFDEMLSRHRLAWSGLWAATPLDMSRPELELPLRLHVFHLLQTATPHSAKRDIGFPAKGWQEGYYGQVFWDEIFAFPFLVTHLPDIAHGLVRYRHRRLSAARELAAGAGFSGAMFPWRSGRTGHEETPPYQCNPLSGRWMPDHTYLQRHIGSAIAFDAWLLYLASGDEKLLADEVGELIVEVARFWSSIAQFDERRQRYVIRGVIGPDEYHNGYPGASQPGLDNNAYTNVMAVWTLCRALDVLTLLSKPSADGLRGRLGITDEEVTRWDDVSRRMYLPVLEDGVLAQFEGFDTLETPEPSWLEDGQPRLDWLLESRGDSCDRYQLTKQADVLMLAYLFTVPELNALILRLGYAVDEDAARRTIDYYMARITHESSLSQVVCAGALARTDPEASWSCFTQCLDVDLCSPSDGGTREGVHLGAMAGSLDVLQRHYLGIHLTVRGIHLAPAPPAALGDVALGFMCRGLQLTVELQATRLRLRSASENRTAIEVHHAEQTVFLSPGEVFEVCCRRG